MTAKILGNDVQLHAALQKSAELLDASRAALIAGMGTDISGARAAVTLAQKIGASIDHMDADAILANLEVMRRAGWIVTTPLQARARADTIFLVGPEVSAASFALLPSLPTPASSASALTPRIVRHLCPDGERALLSKLSALRAMLAGRAVARDDPPLREMVEILQSAKFGVAIWSATAISGLDIEMLCGLIDDLNKRTRFAGLPMMPGNGAEGVTQTLAWLTGLPVRTGFAGPTPQHDPWRYDARRLVQEKEVDAVLWISAFAPAIPNWVADLGTTDLPSIALVAPGTEFAAPPTVTIEVGCPGRDHDSMLFDPLLGAIAHAPATAPTAAARVADLLAAMTAQLSVC